jgi:hypothetical protein
MTSLAKPGSRTDDAALIDRMVHRGFLIPVPGETLIEGGPAQRYRARGVADGALPKFTKLF